MILTPEIIIAFNILFVGIVTATLQIYNSHRTARRDDLMDLRSEVGRLQDRVKQADADIAVLRTENTSLHKQIVQLLDENERLRDDNVQLKRQINDLELKVKMGKDFIGGL